MSKQAPCITIRDGRSDDLPHLIDWLKEPDVLQWYPMCNEEEIVDAAKYWVSFAEKQALLTAEYDNKPCGIVNLYLQSVDKLAHHALLAIIVSTAMRKKGIGTKLLQAIIKRAESLGLETLFLEVYDKNPAIRLYKRMGFQVIGKQKKFIKDRGEYVDKWVMQRHL